MRYYISGPIAGAAHMSREEKLLQFNTFAEALSAEGHTVVNPLDVDACQDRSCADLEDGRHSWECYLRYDLIAMLQRCDAIFMLPNWAESKGACLEHDVAKALSMHIDYAGITK